MDKKVEVTYDALKAASEALITEYVFKHSLEVPENLKAEIEAICESIIQTLLKKNADYQDAWQRYGMFTGLIRLNDKLLRTETLSDGRPALVAEEKIGDTLTDIVGYGLLLRLWMDGQEPVRKPIEWIKNAVMNWYDGTASVGVDYGTDGDTTVYRVGDHIYTKEEFEQLRPNRQPIDREYEEVSRRIEQLRYKAKDTGKPVVVSQQLPLACTDEEGVIHKIVDADKVEHDNKIYEVAVLWHSAGARGDIAEYHTGYGVQSRTVVLVKKDINWRKDELGLRYIYESDLDIKWEFRNDPNTSSDVA